MPGEQSKTERIDFNSQSAMEAVMIALIDGDFFDCLMPGPAAAMEANLDQLIVDTKTKGEVDGNFVVRLSVVESIEEELNPNIPNNVLIQFGYYLNSEGDLGFVTEEYVASVEGKDAELADLSAYTPATPVYEIDWADIDWVAGYALMVGESPAHLLALN